MVRLNAHKIYQTSENYCLLNNLMCCLSLIPTLVVTRQSTKRVRKLMLPQKNNAKYNSARPCKVKPVQNSKLSNIRSLKQIIFSSFCLNHVCNFNSSKLLAKLGSLIYKSYSSYVLKLERMSEKIIVQPHFSGLLKLP